MFVTMMCYILLRIRVAAAGKEFLEAPRQEAEDSMSSPATKSSVFKDSKFKKDSYTGTVFLLLYIKSISLEDINALYKVYIPLKVFL